MFVFAILITFTFILIISFIPVLVLQLYYTISKEEERKLEDIKDKVVTRQATIQAQAEQLEVMLESLDKGAEAERQLTVRITDKNSELDDVLWNLADKSTELDEVKQDMTDKKSEVREQEQKLTIIRERS